MFAGQAWGVNFNRMNITWVWKNFGWLRVTVVGVAVGLAPGRAETTKMPPPQAAAFAAFAPAVGLRWDQNFLYVESDGWPAHGMMVGITAWQQQVPLPQSYRGANAWRIPLHPVPAKTPVSIKGRFLRGAIALAANGIPIFNPQNNRGEVSQEIGELDQWGGHCGRSDDYHYHVAPLHLQAQLGREHPVAYALDGYPIYGLNEPDGSVPVKLDAFHGHDAAGLGYHYHASLNYPYLNGGFHGEVVEREGQVDPQPRAQGVRPALTALRGAQITGFKTTSANHYELNYVVREETRLIRYIVGADGGADFEFQQNGESRFESYKRRSGGGGGGGGGGERNRGGGGADGGARAERPSRPPAEEKIEPVTAPEPSKPLAGFILKSPAVAADGVLPVEFTGDGKSISPPLEWTGAPAGTQSYALIMHHLDPSGQTKWYWTLYHLPVDTRALAPDTHGVGTTGNNSVNRRAGYAPPHSKGPGAKTYVLTLYALAAPLQISTPPEQTNRNVLLAAMQDHVLATAELKVVYTRTGAEPEAAPRAERPDVKSKGKRQP
jgi:phosphatidylethanolamine-binding protein (PEBP) family uncharacterized protein/uncharacterized membrane protein YgcG